MTRSPKDLLDYEARKKPEIAAHLDRCHLMTEAEIDALPILKWLRQALRTERRVRHHRDATTRTDAALAGHVSHSFTPDPLGMVVRWDGPNTFIRFGTGQVEVPSGRLLFLPRSGGVWFETVFSEVIDPRLLAVSREVGPASRTGYIAQYKDDAQRRSGHLAVPTLVAGQAGASSPPETPLGLLAGYGVRVTR